MHFSLRYFGHACFEFSATGAPTVLFDPYNPNGLNGRFNLPNISSNPDLILLTHHHEDHAWILPEWKDAEIAEQTGTPLGLSLLSLSAFHDKVYGRQMGMVSLLSLDWCGVRLVHLGDLGDIPPTPVLLQLGRPDVLMIPVGGTYTIGPDEAKQIIQVMKPRWAIPMHAADPRIQLNLLPVELFLSLWPGTVDTMVHGNIELDLQDAVSNAEGTTTILVPQW